MSINLLTKPSRAIQKMLQANFQPQLPAECSNIVQLQTFSFCLRCLSTCSGVHLCFLNYAVQWIPTFPAQSPAVAFNRSLDSDWRLLHLLKPQEQQYWKQWKVSAMALAYSLSLVSFIYQADRSPVFFLDPLLRRQSQHLF